uniref:Uncharacterized protein n=1 Tax=Vespula pensylvanica TaxID=30213 RepID=A0A834P2U5_VESPE|nr:hypothetical protein H0235_008324 [Vespula pensylvanica]
MNSGDALHREISDKLSSKDTEFYNILMKYSNIEDDEFYNCESEQEKNEIELFDNENYTNKVIDEELIFILLESCVKVVIYQLLDLFVLNVKRILHIEDEESISVRNRSSALTTFDVVSDSNFIPSMFTLIRKTQKKNFKIKFGSSLREQFESLKTYNVFKSQLTHSLPVVLITKGRYIHIVPNSIGIS